MNSFRFLTHTNFHEKDALIEVCKSHLKSIENDEDESILKTILDNFFAKDWTFLNQQEINFINSFDKDKWADYLIFRWKLKNYGRQCKVPDFPIHLLVEPTSICNLRCRMCYQSDKSFSSNKNVMGEMDINLFTRIIDEAVSGGTKAITLASRGEPTINPNFIEMLSYCAGKFYEIKINTNAITLDTNLIHQIFRSNVGIVVFSVDAYNNINYKEIRKKDGFSSIVRNIQNMFDIREKYYPDSKTLLRAHAVRENKDFDEKSFLSFWKNITDEVTVIESIMRSDTYNNPRIDKTNPCSVCFERMYIWYDGTCNPCDIDYKSYLAMGNLKTHTIAQIWNGNKYDHFRSTHLKGERSSIVPCDRCVL